MVEELFTYWNLDSTDEACEELEEALIVSGKRLFMLAESATLRVLTRSLMPFDAISAADNPKLWCTCDTQAADFGPRTALKVVDGVRDQIMGGKLKTGDAIRAELKVNLR